MAGTRPVVVFDFDGTLADTWRDIANALNDTLRGAALPEVSGPDVRFWIGSGALRLLERAVPEPRRTERYLAELYQEFRGHYERRCLDTTEPYPGIVECLGALHSCELAVLSNKPTLFLDRVIEGLGLRSHFGLVLGADALPKPKPSPAAMDHLMQRIDATPAELWMVGDSAIDVETGRTAGARTVGCAWGLRGRDELRRAGTDFLIESPAEIPPLILGDA